MKKTILVFESSDILFFSDFKLLFNNEKLEIIRASTLIEGEKKFSENRGAFDFILVGDCQPKSIQDSISLVKKIRESGYRKPIITYLSYSQDSLKLKVAGGENTHFFHKDDSVKKAIELLQL